MTFSMEAEHAPIRYQHSEGSYEKQDSSPGKESPHEQTLVHMRLANAPLSSVFVKCVVELNKTQYFLCSKNSSGSVAGSY